MKTTISNITSVVVIGGALILGTLGYMSMANHLQDLVGGHYATFPNREVVHVNSHGLSDEVELIAPAPDPEATPSESNQGKK